MSLINLFVAAKSAIANRRRRQRTAVELMALDDRSLADIGIHRSQIPALVEGLYETALRAEAPITAPSHADLAGHRWLPRF